MYAVTSAEMQTMDRLTIAEFGLPGRLLMENAGREAARVFLAQPTEAIPSASIFFPRRTASRATPPPI